MLFVTVNVTNPLKFAMNETSIITGISVVGNISKYNEVLVTLSGAR